jgi:hypothetical protein
MSLTMIMIRAMTMTMIQQLVVIVAAAATLLVVLRVLLLLVPVNNSNVDIQSVNVSVLTTFPSRVRKISVVDGVNVATDSMTIVWTVRGV